MAKKISPRKDFLQIAKHVADIATGDKPKDTPPPKKKPTLKHTK